MTVSELLYPAITRVGATVTHVGGPDALIDEDDSTYLALGDPTIGPVATASVLFNAITVPVGATLPGTSTPGYHEQRFARGFSTNPTEQVIVSTSVAVHVFGGEFPNGTPGDSGSTVEADVTPDVFYYEDFIGGMDAELSATTSAGLTVTKLWAIVTYDLGATYRPWGRKVARDTVGRKWPRPHGYV